MFCWGDHDTAIDPGGASPTTPKTWACRVIERTACFHDRMHTHSLAMKTTDLGPTHSDTTGGGRRHGHDLAERPCFDFMASSHDLAEGLDVQDLSDVTIPGDLVDSLFGATR
jgi:hypothetical protein